MKLPRIPYVWLLVSPWICLGIGLTLNCIAMAINHGQMNVQFPGGNTDGFNLDVFHCPMTAQTHLKFLCDWISIRGVGIASPGDILEWTYDATVLPFIYIWITLMVRDQNDSQL